MERKITLVMDPYFDNHWNYCSCYTNILLPGICCYQATVVCCMQPDAMCLDRTIKYDLLQLQKAHATLHNDSDMAAKAERRINSLLARELKSCLSGHFRVKFRGKKESSIMRNDRPMTRSEKVVLRRTVEGKIGIGQILKRMAKGDQQHKTKESRKKKITLEMTLAEIEFEKARLKKLENEEKRKEDNLKNIKPKKKGPKTHFRKSKKPGRA